MSNLKLNNVLSTGENTFIVRMSFSELKDLIDSGAIHLDINKEVPCVPLEDEGVIYLNIDGNFVSGYNKEKELTISDKFRVLDGEIRLINFINNTNLYEDKMDQIITLNIVCFDVEGIRESLSNMTLEYMQEKTREFYNEVAKNKDSNIQIPKIPINTEGIKDITLTIPAIDENRRKEIEGLDEAHRNMIIGQGRNNIINFGNEFLNREISALLNRNNGDGWHRIVPVIRVLIEKGKTDIEIAKMLKEMK